ncbi:hypothetical protein DYH09_26155 [bacterium CPR1]|nr:hypothetical protein [bacterium CPR1]
MRWLAVTLLLVLPIAAQSELPPGYKVMRQFGKPARWRRENLPIRLFSSAHERLVDHCLARWNQAGQGVLYRRSSADEADVRLDWSSPRLPAGRAGAVWWNPVMGYLLVDGMAVDGEWNVSQGVRARVLLQELGHCLGLSDSTNPGDVMYTVVVNHRRRPQPLEAARLSARDQQALAWLYAQEEFVPIQVHLPDPAAPTPVPMR